MPNAKNNALAIMALSAVLGTAGAAHAAPSNTLTDGDLQLNIYDYGDQNSVSLPLAKPTDWFDGYSVYSNTGFETPTADRDGQIDDYSPGAPSVGTFSQEQAGSGGRCGQSDVGCTGLRILDSDTTPYGGRFATEGDQWLDSNDSERTRWKAPTDSEGTVEINKVGFFITDPDDAGGTMSIETEDGSAEFKNVFTGQNESTPNGSVFFLELFGTDDGLPLITQIDFLSVNPSDGFGLDDWTVAQFEGGGQEIPVPGTLSLLGAALIGAGVVFRRRRT